jgi:hypothetical protein
MKSPHLFSQRYTRRQIGFTDLAMKGSSNVRRYIFSPGLAVRSLNRFGCQFFVQKTQKDFLTLIFYLATRDLCRRTGHHSRYKRVDADRAVTNAIA